MNEQNDQQLDQSDEDVVVIQERDKYTLIYIAVAVLLGLAIGGLGGAVMTKSKWQQAYNQLEFRVERIEQDKTQVVVKVEEKAADIEGEVQRRIQEQLDELALEHEQELNQTKAMITELEKVNLDLEQEAKELRNLLADANSENNKLLKQADMQSVVIERSRELFQQEFKIKQELEKLQNKREKLVPEVERLKKACEQYVDGESFDAGAQSCDKHDELNSELSQTDQMIEVYKLDLREMEHIADSIGL